MAELQRSSGDLVGDIVITLPALTFDRVERDLSNHFGGHGALVVDRHTSVDVLQGATALCCAGVFLRRGT